METARSITAKKGRMLAVLLGLAGALASAALVAAGGPAEAAFPGQNGKIAFVRGSKSPPVSPAGEIYVMNSDGTDQTRLSTDARVDEFPAFSPAGDEIVFSSDRDGNFEIYTMKAAPEGSENHPSRLTNNPAIDSKPDWGPFSDFDEFYAPVDGPPAVNAVRAGSAVPVKFSLGGDQGLDVFATGYQKSRRVDCHSGALTDALEQTATAGESGLSYDAATGEYAYVWKTSKAWSGTCRQVLVKLNDTTVHRALFELK